ncbi:hypothetical protein L9F63_009618 [Diploptera punctata]|uniref:Uncharacterized protein n=1 Tax=Diploptera punctata TaxID=6984 RepID=A0AAD8AK14_DIPPU|nr:hypothetical protein L9F63_009618 [Diploptera punctata]
MHKHSSQLLMQHRQYKSEMKDYNGSVPGQSPPSTTGVSSTKKHGPMEPIRRWNSFHTRDRRSNTMSSTIEHFRQHQQKIKSSMMTGGGVTSATALSAAAGYMGMAAGAAGITASGMGAERNSRSIPRVMALRSESADIPCPRGPPPPPPAFPRRRFSVW